MATRNYNTLSETELQPSEDNNEIGNIQSIMAGFASGLYKIPEGFASLGATLMDLGADTNKAAEVEKWFADICKEKIPDDYINAKNLNDIIHIETDVLLYQDLELIMPILKEFDFYINTVLEEDK